MAKIRMSGTRETTSDENGEYGRSALSWARACELVERSKKPVAPIAAATLKSRVKIPPCRPTECCSAAGKRSFSVRWSSGVRRARHGCSGEAFGGEAIEV